MRRVIAERVWILARHYFGKSAIASARSTCDPIEYLRKDAVDSCRGFSCWGDMDIRKVFCGAAFVNTRQGQVIVCGEDSNGHLDFSNVLFQVSCEQLARAALADYVQMELFFFVDGGVA